MSRRRCCASARAPSSWFVRESGRSPIAAPEDQRQTWESRVAALWASADALDGDELVAAMDALASERPTGDAAALFERGGARDSTGHSDLAIPFYRRALDSGLADDRRRQAVIQLASSLRNIGEVAEAVELLTAERVRGSDELDDAVSAFLALALADLGREREAAAVALAALASHLPRYQRSVANYARLLVGEHDEA